ncbi:toprim domain-containing protein [Anaerotignum lactatifermentans]|uniref:Toprim domain-containing protein n=1 Tax=Anaerotignum lactatifermentans TaxID=160404 RepID=A0ABS2GEA1_9FIRM|nr:DUF3991 and toprim domain-containing protein [Anaerotignum lactatifermentans]MBM6830315.1 toprim domain-containing protein [Anaerotignum lactatifermentans]MBM6878873.1 toprim domain-containing protein [Anaerotignum lactatifermentans]MBM6951993.1 toprim domain-containing protein [Anaerotignum lactatifermentans]
MALYTQEQIDKANQTNLEEFLQQKGERLKKTGSESVLIYKDSTGEHDSISVRRNRWYDHKNMRGGYPLKFMQEFYGMNFRTAMKELLHGEEPELGRKRNKENEKNVSQSEKKSVQENREQISCPSEKSEFILPEKDRNMKRLFAYLLQKRFLSQSVVKCFVEQKILYQEKEHGNIVFVGTDKEGVPKSACKKSTTEQSKSFRMTVAGSDCKYGFCWRGENTKLYVFEAAIDLMSFITWRNDEWKADSFLALDGLSPKPLLQFLEEQKNIHEIFLCLDYDAAGIEACDKLKDILIEKGYEAEKIKREYPLYKDWNEQLKAEHGVEAILPQSHPKKTAYHVAVRKLGIMNADTESLYMKWRKQGHEKTGLFFYLDQIKRDFKQAEKAVRKRDTDIKLLLTSILRMADLSVCLMCEVKGDNNLPELTMYQTAIQKLEKAYKPYLDKARMDRRIQEMKEEMEHLKTLAVQEQPSLFVWAKNMADMAMRAIIYVETEYPQELERKNSFAEQKELASASEEKKSVEQITLQM